MEDTVADGNRAGEETIRRERKWLVPSGPGDPPQRLLPGVHCAGSNDSLAHSLGALADEGRKGKTTKTTALRRPSARHGGAHSGAQRRWRSPRDGCSRAGSHSRLNTTSPDAAVSRPPRRECGQGRGSSEPAQAPGCQPQQVSDHRG